MNREQKRMMQKQGQMAADGSPARPDVDERRRAATKPPQDRTSIRQFFTEVRDELRRVTWPTRAETRSYSTVVLVLIVLLGAIIFALNFGLEKGVGYLLHS